MFIEDPGLNGITIRDLTMYRRKRAEI